MMYIMENYNGNLRKIKSIKDHPKVIGGDTYLEEI